MTRTTPVGGILDLRTRRAIAVVRIAFGAVWAADAALKWLPGFVHGTFLGTLMDARSGQPAPVRAWIDVFVSGFDTHPAAWAYALAVAETALAICLLAGAFTTVACAFGAWLSLGIWTTAEGFGGPYRSGSTDVSASIVYVLVFALLLATAAGGTWGADAWLRPRLGHWRWLCSRTPHPDDARATAPSADATAGSAPSADATARTTPPTDATASTAHPANAIARATVARADPPASAGDATRPETIDGPWADEVSGLADALATADGPDDARGPAPAG